MNYIETFTVSRENCKIIFNQEVDKYKENLSSINSGNIKFISDPIEIISLRDYYVYLGTRKTYHVFKNDIEIGQFDTFVSNDNTYLSIFCW